jgi:hypothetical protein
MTPAEFLLYIEGYNWRDEQVWQRTAWQTANLMNVWLDKKDRVTVEDLLPKKKEQKKEPMSDEQMARNALAWAIAMGAVDKRKSKGAV